MPSVMTLEGPRLAQHGTTSQLRALGQVSAATGIAPGKLALYAVGAAALLGAAWMFIRHDRSQDRRWRRALRGGPEMLKIIAAESRSPEEFARRAEAWNAAEATPLPVGKLARAYRKASPTTMARLIREAREARTVGRERLWSRMSKGLRALDGYRVAFLDRGKRDVSPIEFPTVEGAAAMARSYKRRGWTTWVEDDAGNFVPVKGAMHKPKHG